MENRIDTPLARSAALGKMDFWNDSCAPKDLEAALAQGAVGATSNPVIVYNVIKQDPAYWRPRILQVAAENPCWSDLEVTWKVYVEAAQRGAQLLEPIFQRTGGLKGRLSIQTDPAFYRNPDAIVAQGMEFDRLAPNFQIKVPVTKAGIIALEELTYRGINTTATVSFTVPQVVAIAEAVERGMRRREAEGKDVSTMTPMAVMMVGRLDDWMQVLSKREGIAVRPGTLEWAGVACLKKAYGFFQERGYRARLLVAAFRHLLHWHEFLGGDVVLTIPPDYQHLINNSGLPVEERMDVPVPAEILDTLYSRFPDFRRAYDENGLSLEEFETYGATSRTLRSFIASLHDLTGLIRDFMLPNPDL
jgi:transaldolase